jgi:hypothetical protein
MMRVQGHALSVEWNHERGEESGSTGTCRCGWQESGSSQRVVRQEYRHHLAKVRASVMAKAKVYVHDIDTGVVAHVFETDTAGTTNYDRFIDGVMRKVDLERFYVDTDAADKVHEAAKGNR